MNFYDAKYQTSVNAVSFGICYGDDASAAYVDVQNEDRWIAVVENKESADLIFTAIDKGIIKNNDHPDRGRCDGMITRNQELLYFVELKDQNKKWMTPAIEQLESTILFFIEYHDISSYRYKKAFACNRAHPHFNVIDNESNLKFFRKYGVRLDIQAKIVVI